MTQMTQIAQPWTNAGILLSKHSSFIKLFSCYAIIRFTDVEWVVSNRILRFAQRFLGSPRGKNCNSPEGNIWRKVVWRLLETVRYVKFSYLIEIYKWFRLSIHNQTTCMRHVFYRPIYGTVPRAYNGTLSVCFFRRSRELWVGVNRNVVAKSWNQVNKLVQLFHVFDTFKKTDFGERSTIFITYD